MTKDTLVRKNRKPGTNVPGFPSDNQITAKFYAIASSAFWISASLALSANGMRVPNFS